LQALKLRFSNPARYLVHPGLRPAGSLRRFKFVPDKFVDRSATSLHP